jgi:hypothetical protein
MIAPAIRRAVLPRPAASLLSRAGVLLAPTALYTALALLMARPLLSAFGQTVPVRLERGLENDALLNLWILTWVTHALTTDPASVFHANIFYPERYTLAYSEHQLGVVPLFGPLWALLGSPAAAFEVHYLLTFVLTGLTTFGLVRLWTPSLPAALFAGLAFAFAPPRLAHHYGTQLMAIWWLPLCLLLVERFLRRPTTPRALLAAGAFALQWLSSLYLGWFLTVALAIYLAAALLAEPRLLRCRPVLANGLLAGLLAALIVGPTLLPYQLVSQRWAVEWPLEHLVSHSARPLGFLSVTPANLLYGPLLQAIPRSDDNLYELFLGLSPIVLALVGLVASRRPGPPDRQRPVRGTGWLAATFLALGLLALVLSFGPYGGPAGTLPLPYLALYEWLPGFQAMRNPVRFVFLVCLALAVLSGLGVAALLDRARSPASRRVLAVALLALLGLETFTLLPAERLPTFDQAALAHLRATATDGPLVELPASWDRGVSETPRMVASIAHWRPLLGGYSGFKPPREPVETILQEAEPATVADVLAVLGIRTLVLHLDQLEPKDRARYASPAWRQAGFVEQLRTERTAVWSLQSPRRPSLASAVSAELQPRQRVRAGALAHVRLTFEAEAGQVFRQPADGARPVLASWQPLEPAGQPLRQELRVALPLVVVVEPNVKVDLDLLAPSEPGHYRLELRGEHFLAERSIMVARGRDD